MILAGLRTMTYGAISSRGKGKRSLEGGRNIQIKEMKTADIEGKRNR